MPDARKPSPPLKLMSAARTSARTQRPLKERIRGEAANVALNLASIGRENWEQLRGTDRLFKIKALIVASWLVISIASLVVACPGSIRSRNSLGAQLVITMVGDHPVYMIKNDGRSIWKNVLVVVNRRFRATAALVEPGNNLTFGPKQLVAETGQVAPEDLELTDLEIRTSEGSAWLLEAGQIR
jgi:hypothetical protein